MADDDRFYVKTLTLENFRCFERMELTDLDPHFNLLIGENGVGKSSVLVALAAIFSRMGTEPGRPDLLIANASDIRRNAGLDDMLNRAHPVHALLSANFFPATSPFAKKLRIQSEASATISSERDISLSLTRISPSFTLLAPKEEFGNHIAVPVIASYWADRNFRNEMDETSQVEKLSSPRFAGLHNWANSGLGSRALTEWLRDETLAKYQRDARYFLRRGADEDPEGGYFLDLVTGAILAGIEDAKHIEYSGSWSEIALTYKDGRKQKLSEMSDGQRALVCLIADLARRICILNGWALQERTLLDTPGLVLIDEIDLHLHPKWQRQIVKALKGIFPKIQFFATTHSPQVIGEAQPHEVVLLSKDGKQKRPMGSYGMDSNWILECVMEAEGRNPEIAKRVTALFDLIDEGDFEEARAEINRLRKEIGPLAPDIAGAESYMWRIEHEADEAAE